jgi:coatomer subunit epsilon
VRGEAVKIERDVFVYRSYIAVGNYAVVLDEIKETASTPPDLLAVRLLATYLSRPAAKETCVLTAHQLLEDFSAFHCLVIAV